MKKIARYKNKNIRFRRYSRNGYAVFFSLNKIITIGRLAEYIADKGLSKSNKLNTSTNTSNSSVYIEEEAIDHEFDEQITFNININLLIFNNIKNETSEQNKQINHSISKTNISDIQTRLNIGFFLYNFKK